MDSLAGRKWEGDNFYVRSIGVNKTPLSPEEYVDYYKARAVAAEEEWHNKDRPEYEAILWFNQNCSDICVRMMGDLCYGKRLIDLGCGRWGFEQELVKQLSPEESMFVDIAGGEGIVEADACDTPFRNSTFDIVVCRELIEHVPSPQKLLDEIYRLLKDGGYVLISTPNGFNVFPDGKEHVRAYLPNGFLADIELTGFTIIDKRGDVPNVHSALLPMARGGLTNVLFDFKQAAEMVDEFKDSYYTGTQMFVLAQKVVNRDGLE
jgi:SAM-dependent methyltransferase